MPQVISFENYTPTARYDSIPWTEARIQEGVAVTGPWTLIDTKALSPVDPDPSNPATRSFTTELATDLPDLWYRIVFADATGDVLQPTVPVQNSAPVYYVDVDELARILKIRQPTVEQHAAMERVLAAAAAEINAEIDLAAAVTLAAEELALVQEVNLERAVEHWRQQETPFGLMVVGVDMPAERTGMKTWDRHAEKLAVIKSQWGFA